VPENTTSAEARLEEFSDARARNAELQGWKFAENSGVKERQWFHLARVLREQGTIQVQQNE
jgi:hypothetical protein